MPRFVTPLDTRATRTHLGTGAGTRCGQVLRSVMVCAAIPADRPLCRPCGQRATPVESQAVTGDTFVELRDALLASLLREGMTQVAMSRHLNAGRRTVVRWVSEATRRAGAETMWQWGYRVGSCDRGA